MSDANKITIDLPLPGRDLSPNSRGHWAKKHRAAKVQREMAKMLTMSVMREEGIRGPWSAATVRATGRYAKLRRRDGDNLNASLKSAIDGIADAGLVANDTHITLLPPIIVIDKSAAPRVDLEITAAHAPGQTATETV